MSRKQPCHSFSLRGSCRFGVRCKFAHDSLSGTRSPHPQSSSSGRRPQGQTTDNSSEKSLPPGACRSWWKDGTCRQEFNCRFRHIRPQEKHPRPKDGQPALPGSSGPLDMDAIAPYLTDAGLAKISGSSADIFSLSSGRKLDPQETKNHLQRYLHNDYRFQNVVHMHTFVSLLNNASSENKSWVGVLSSLYRSNLRVLIVPSLC